MKTILLALVLATVPLVALSAAPLSQAEIDRIMISAERYGTGRPGHGHRSTDRQNLEAARELRHLLDRDGARSHRPKFRDFTTVKRFPR